MDLKTKEITPPNREGRPRGWSKAPDSGVANSLDLFLTLLGVSNTLIAKELGTSSKTAAKYRRDSTLHTAAFFDAIRSAMSFLADKRGKSFPDISWDMLDVLQTNSGG